ncbi:hypothetical protein ABB07_10835 [Streptomyces incarnatus]|uniref:Uncharacterized protein n=1 Tax=Streptomyces incarnatus TaxID=665007 RepID=A0ABM5THR4_9ACTN|nr:hypothetical protein [Streptomyces incarnatus]AKJ10495.1 hypothetical protein ABB07_10835 [Streptomyces incarnatus]
MAVSYWMRWGVTGLGEAGEAVADMSSALRALDISVRRAQERLCTPSEAVMLGESAERMREQMLTDGVRAMGLGNRWSFSVQNLEVTLIPRSTE